ncbi:amine oxidoreductase [Phragmitibacter flavus]|uniref:Amine oxidoreductase n=1 Tax=Phragmitibacter flavus TaxID=2576071 RepID=A0A5R8K7Y3_9BACT|nr:FAD-dependent oxidoreductase [Phragmitibacter flavus]TLD68433.1 amine oxidoreductase [Phragmitibacter flavus]
MSEKFDYVIIGAGMSGVTMARLLQLSGVKSLLVLEAEDQAGGLCQTKKIGNHYLDTGGGHFLCTKHPEVYDFIFSHYAKSEFNYFNRVSTIRIGGSEVDYPLESNIWQLPVEQCADYLISIVRNAEARGAPPPSDFEGWLRWKLGDLVTDNYMIPYNRKIWGVEPTEMDVDWLSKIPRLKVEEIVQQCLKREVLKDTMPSHEVFYYPKSGGFQEIFDAILKPVAEHVLCNTPVETIEKSGDDLLVNGRYLAGKVIVTVPWKTLTRSPIMPQEIKDCAMRLQHNTLMVSLHEEEYTTNAHWTYVPDVNQDSHREFFIRNFAPHSQANGLYRETNVKRWNENTETVYAHKNDYAYPIPVLNWAATIKTILDWGEENGVIGLGRWGQWQYFNSDVCIHQAMKLADRLGYSGWRSALEIPA